MQYFRYVRGLSVNSREANTRFPGMLKKRECISLPAFKPKEKAGIILCLFLAGTSRQVSSTKSLSNHIFPFALLSPVCKKVNSDSAWHLWLCPTK